MRMVQTIRTRDAGFAVVRGGKPAALNVRYQILAHEFVDRHAGYDVSPARARVASITATSDRDAVQGARYRP
jgi:hypothetical protein